MHGHIFTNKPDIIILKQTWLLNSEILPDETFKRLRADRSGKNSLPHWQVKKIRQTRNYWRLQLPRNKLA